MPKKKSNKSRTERRWPPIQPEVGLPQPGQGFQLVSPFEPAGDQPQAIEALCQGLDDHKKHQVLLGITGSGKTFTIANVIAHHKRPTLVLAPNKTLAAQLFSELTALFPHNAVEYFVSYYDYYQPEAYVVASDTYIEKDSLINEQIDRLRHAATRSLLEREDLIIVASVSCIYGLGSAEAYHGMLLQLNIGQSCSRKDILRKLIDIQYERNDTDFHRGTFRSRGDVIDIFPPYEEDQALRIELFGDEIDGLSLFDPLRGTTITTLQKVAIYPASHYVTPKEQLDRARHSIREELFGCLDELRSLDKLLEAQRLAGRTLFDLEMIEECGRCKGIENYSRHLSGREPGQPPPTLIEYFPRPWLLIVDESHIAVPQLGAMYHGDRSRKEKLVDHGFRLPSAMDNRPLRFEEFEDFVDQAIYVSATPGKYEIEKVEGQVVDQIIRPTGLLDPEILVRPASIQVDDSLDAIGERIKRGERILVTVLTKRMAQELSEYYREVGLKARYMHSDVQTLERISILRDLRAGEFDVLVGINLLREGLDLPEVSLVCIMDADKTGFLRNTRSLIQTIGRASRNAHGQVILYADTITDAMDEAITTTRNRRALQHAHNERHGISPKTIQRPVHSPLDRLLSQTDADLEADEEQALPATEIPKLIKQLRKEMKKAADHLEFEKAAQLRDRIRGMERTLLTTGIDDEGLSVHQKG